MKKQTSFMVPTRFYLGGLNVSLSKLHRFVLTVVLLAAMTPAILPAAEFEAKPDNAYFAKFEPLKAPAPGPLLLQTNDRLAICGDSITERKMYSRIIETYLTVCVPDLKLTVRQYGWGGEFTDGFQNRMVSDCLRFQPTVATVCYGMNDHRYKPFDEGIGKFYTEHTLAILQQFKQAGVRVVLGSPGCIGKIPPWVNNPVSTVEAMNLSLCTLRNINLELAQQQNVRFADVFWPMFTSAYAASRKYGDGYELSGQDGVHPDWAGQLVMAYAFLRAMGLDGNIDTFTVDLNSGKATTSAGHVDCFTNNCLTITSRRYPFCAAGPLDKFTSIRSGMTLVPFNAELNRLMLVVTGGKAQYYTVKWGDQTRDYTASQLAQGVNLAEDFQVNPFSEAFNRVDYAVIAKQCYETWQIKEKFHDFDGLADIEAVVKQTEAERAPLAEAIAKDFVPVTHTIQIQPK
jgi:lysophospholipase L1-like esterase